MIWVLYGWRRELEGEIKIFIPHPKLVLYTIQGYVGDNASMTVRAMSEMVMDQTKSLQCTKIFKILNYGCFTFATQKKKPCPRAW